MLKMSPLRKLTSFIKWAILDEIFILRDSEMPEYQLIEENEKIAKRVFFDFVSFRSGLKDIVYVTDFFPTEMDDQQISKRSE